jgi:hypothetical protein
MKTDLLKDIRTIRDKIGAECGYDPGRLGALVRREESRAGKRLVQTVKPIVRRRRSSTAVAVS